MRYLVGSKAKVIVLAIVAAIIMGVYMQAPAASASFNTPAANTLSGGKHHHGHHHHRHHHHRQTGAT
ncbi:MAG TPA: hypothetical protein VMG59_12750 [Phycisphaerae bacterium]|nr:hypothetical protein [Phycisphaerae bacterium]